MVGIILLSLNLRPAAVSVGPVLAEIRDEFSMSGPTAGLLTSLPVIGFAVFGAMAPAAAHRIGLHRVTIVAVDGTRIRVRALEAIDGTPVVDMKPVLRPDGR